MSYNLTNHCPLTDRYASSFIYDPVNNPTNDVIATAEKKKKTKRLPLQLINKVEEKLWSAFRQGLNESVQGLHRIAPSDHLPIAVDYKDGIDPSLKMASWNILSDIHLGNYFRNMSLVNELAHNPDIDDDNIFKLRCNWLLYYLAEHMRQRQGMDLIIDEEALWRFVEECPFSHEKVPLAKLRSDARAIIRYYLESPDRKHELLFQSIAHALEVHYAIYEGFLRWPERLNVIRSHASLCRQLGSRDIICLQECTCPDDMLHLMRQKTSKDYVMIENSTRTGDHCAIIFDSAKYCLADDNKDCLAVKKFSLGHTMKPCILAKFKSLVFPETHSFIVGSIHHPGGDEHALDKVFQEIGLLQSDKYENIFIMGDFNHESGFFQNTPSGLAVKMPSMGTMAGPDFSCTNKAIDGILTNRIAHVTLQVINLGIAPPLNLPMTVQVRIRT